LIGQPVNELFFIIVSRQIEFLISDHD
jgi:hypothetical protein